MCEERATHLIWQLLVEKASGVLDGLLVTEGARVREGLGGGEGCSGGSAKEGDTSREGTLLGLPIWAAVGVVLGVAVPCNVTPSLLLTVRDAVGDGNTGITTGDRVTDGVLDATKEMDDDGDREGEGEVDTKAKGKTVATGEHSCSTSNLMPTSPNWAGPVIPMPEKVATPSVVEAEAVPDNV